MSENLPELQELETGMLKDGETLRMISQLGLIRFDSVPCSGIRLNHFNPQLCSGLSSATQAVVYVSHGKEWQQSVSVSDTHECPSSPVDVHYQPSLKFHSLYFH